MNQPIATQLSDQNHPDNEAAKSSPDQTPPKKKRTGITRYNPEFAILICERIATTPQSVVKICEAPDMPGVATIFRWLREHPDFHEIYAEAKQLQAELLIEEALDLVDDTSQDMIVTADGKTVFNRLGFQRCKMRVEYRKWIASKLLPRKYGNRLEPKAPAPPPEPAPKEVMSESRRKQLIARRRRQMEQKTKEKAKSAAKAPAPASAPTPNLQSPISELPTPISESPSPNSDLQSPTPPLTPPPASGWTPPQPPKRIYPWHDIVTPKPKKTTLQKAVS